MKARGTAALSKQLCGVGGGTGNANGSAQVRQQDDAATRQAAQHGHAGAAPSTSTQQALVRTLECLGGHDAEEALLAPRLAPRVAHNPEGHCVDGGVGREGHGRL